MENDSYSAGHRFFALVILLLLNSIELVLFFYSRAFENPWIIFYCLPFAQLILLYFFIREMEGIGYYSKVGKTLIVWMVLVVFSAGWFLVAREQKAPPLYFAILWTLVAWGPMWFFILAKRNHNVS
ncbi:MAG: hypothetical protein E7G49_04620 [Cutibacterium granulosum]|nr:hypothetical protein [Cutibacterium granulosum]